MRPQSETRVALAAALLDGPGTVRQLAQRTGWSIGRVRTALDNMERAGDVCVVDAVPQRGCKRRVPVYGRAQAVEVDIASACRHQALAGVLQGWHQWPAYVQPSAGAPM
ncbi:MAG: EAP30/Vps36 family vacuolar-sorting protein [Burkholderiaceae bacterium]|nr:EAP30/Vps36 family vacuolar-sorting protein [Burkholderiaceae bacterium]MCU0964065.1 EAP30/Vps36 family vacuolar-sorting protein [Burkholderiaceae bacterium]